MEAMLFPTPITRPTAPAQPLLLSIIHATMRILMLLTIHIIHPIVLV